MLPIQQNNIKTVKFYSKEIVLHSTVILIANFTDFWNNRLRKSTNIMQNKVNATILTSNTGSAAI